MVVKAQLKYLSITTCQYIKELMKKDFVGNWIPAESLNIIGDIYFESASLIGVNNSTTASL